MKRRRQELNIFGVAALDLFASALGAFMIVTFVLFPYFPNTAAAPSVPTPDPSPPVGTSDDEMEALRRRLSSAENGLAAARRREEELEETLREARSGAPDLAPLQDRLASVEAELSAARRRGRELEHALDEANRSIRKLPPTDLMVALDTTGSMHREVTGLAEEIAGLAELLLRLAGDAAVGVIAFKDRCDPGTAMRVSPIRRVDGASVRALTTFARSMRAGSPRCNELPEEDVAEALQAAVSADWRPGSERRHIVLISDNPAHADMRWKAIEDARQFAARPGAAHTVSAVLVDTTDVARRHADAVPFMRSVAEAGNGQFVQSDQNASLSVTILRAIFED